jgi:hypothetical protein
MTARHGVALALLLAMTAVRAADGPLPDVPRRLLPACEGNPPSVPPVGGDKSPSTECKPVVLPFQFAEPPSLGVRNNDRTAPPDMPGLGYHCHWIAPEQKYCHGGIN